MASNESTVPFELGTPDACAWKARYKPFGPKGIGWKEPGFENFLRVSIGTEGDNARFVQALLAALEV